MAKPTVLVTRRVPQAALDALAVAFDVEANDGAALSHDELCRRGSEKDALVTLLTDRIDRTVFERCRRLRVVANVAVGYDNIDLAAARERGVAVSNTPGVLTDATADFAFALLLAAARQVPQADRFVREGRFAGWEMMTFLGAEIAGSTLGIAGFGRIGQGVARRAAGFGMQIIYSDELRADLDAERACGARYVDKPALLAESDFLSLHVPLTPETRHYLGAPEFEQMKSGAFVINTARGPIVDERALARACSSRRIAGAALDVFEREPAVEPELLACDNVVLAPHIASATVSTRTKMALMAAENAIAGVQGRELPNRVV